MRSWYFGPLNNVSTPTLWDPKRHWLLFRDSGLPSEITSRVDGGFCPGVNLLDLSFPSEGYQLAVEGLFRWVYAEGLWTCLGAWDRSGVDHPGMHATFVIEGILPPKIFWPWLQETWLDVFGRISSRTLVRLEGYMGG